MRTLLILMTGLIFSGHVFADCAGSGLWAFPNTKNIKQNSWIMIEGYARTQKIINSLNKDYPIYLESDEHKVKLTVKSTYKGMYSLTQAILIPDEKLITGKKYYLKIDNLGEYEKGLLTKWNSETNQSESIAWTIDDGTDIMTPKLLGSPKLIDKRTMHYGCGPAIYADFKISTKDETEVLVKTELVDLTSEETNVYYINFSNSDTLSVGHGMCSGAFNYKSDHKYKIRFSLMDSCGNTDNKWTSWVEFDSPFEGY